MPRAPFSPEDERCMRRALALAARAWGATSPNPMVGAVLARAGGIIGEGWHRRAGGPHAEINALRSAQRRGHDPRGATLYVTLEPCSTFGRTPPCTEAILAHGIRRVVAGAVDPNPSHAGRGFKILRKQRVPATSGLLAEECGRLNEAFNHWVVERRPFVTLKSAMSLDGKIATNTGESNWITGERARAFGMRLRVGSDAILCGINTILRDDPALSLRPAPGVKIPPNKEYRRIILDRHARTPLTAKVVTDENAGQTIIAVSPSAPVQRVKALEKRARIVTVPLRRDHRSFQLDRLLEELARENITSILVEGGGETHAGFLEQRLAQRIWFFYAPLIIGGRAAPKSVGGEHTFNHNQGFRLEKPEWQPLGPDLLLTGRVRY